MAELKTRILLRNDTAAAWSTANPVLSKGEIGIEIDTRKVKVGDGTKNWNALDYINVRPEDIVGSEKQYIVPVEAGADHAAAIAEAVGDDELNPGDIAIVKELINGAKGGAVEHRQYTAYVWNGSAWEAMDGNYSAENVYFKNDLIYTSAIGVLAAPTKAEGSKTLSAEGKNLKQVLSSIMAKEENPTASQPSLTINSSNIGAKEAGTNIAVAYTTSFNPGSYTYGPATGITSSDLKISFNGETKTGASGTFASVQVTDTCSMDIVGTFDHTEGKMPVTNLGNEYPAVKIAASNDKAAVKKGNLSGYRKMFYGTLTNKGDITSAVVRGLVGSEREAAKSGNSLTVNVPVGAVRVVIAVPQDKTTISGKTWNRSVTSVKDVNDSSAEILSAFSDIRDVVVEGAEGFTGINYKVYICDYAKPAAVKNTYKVTIA